MPNSYNDLMAAFQEMKHVVKLQADLDKTRAVRKLVAIGFVMALISGFSWRAYFASSTSDVEPLVFAVFSALFSLLYLVRSWTTHKSGQAAELELKSVEPEILDQIAEIEASTKTLVDSNDPNSIYFQLRPLNMTKGAFVWGGQFVDDYLIIVKGVGPDIGSYDWGKYKETRIVARGEITLGAQTPCLLNKAQIAVRVKFFGDTSHFQQSWFTPENLKKLSSWLACSS